MKLKYNTSSRRGEKAKGSKLQTLEGRLVFTGNKSREAQIGQKEKRDASKN